MLVVFQVIVHELHDAQAGAVAGQAGERAHDNNERASRWIGQAGADRFGFFAVAHVDRRFHAAALLLVEDWRPRYSAIGPGRSTVRRRVARWSASMSAWRWRWSFAAHSASISRAQARRCS